MKTLNNPSRNSWQALTKRPAMELAYLDTTVRNIIDRVKKGGDNALLSLTEEFDKTNISSLAVSKTEVDDALTKVDLTLKQAIATAAHNIEKFHAAQKRDVLRMETMPGVSCWRKGVPIESVGIYIPGGTAPLFSTVLMLAIPARLAGCRNIVLCTPPQKEGSLNPAIVFAANLAGVTQLFKVGGAQAIAAMALGTESVPKVYKIFGPGNQYVTKAKQIVSEEGVAIDMPAGPSEVLVVIDETAEPSFVAADLLSQAEHGIDSQVVLVSTREEMIPRVLEEVDKQVAGLPRAHLAKEALKNSLAVSFNNPIDLIDFVNEYAPEHLIIQTRNDEELAEQVINAGSVFLGSFTPESAGDYASGTNHTLPTNGFAKAYSGVSLESFMKYITFQKITQEGLQKIGPVIEEMAAAEQLVAHKEAVSTRLRKIRQ